MNYPNTRTQFSHMNLQVFFIALALGALVALYVSWRFAHRGIHPRFYPHFGLVAVVFLGLMGAMAFLAFVMSHMVGNPVPPVQKAPTTSVPETNAEAPAPAPEGNQEAEQAKETP